MNSKACLPNGFNIGIPPYRRNSFLLHNFKEMGDKMVSKLFDETAMLVISDQTVSSLEIIPLQAINDFNITKIKKKIAQLGIKESMPEIDTQLQC